MGFVWFILAIIAALFFYWLRDNHRTWYGFSEIIVGIAILFVDFVATPPNTLITGESYSTWLPTATTLIALFTGIYAIVRGIDNIIGEIRKQ